MIRLTGILLCAALGLAACSQGEDPSSVMGQNGAGGGLSAGGSGGGTVMGPDGRPISVDSIAYFDQVIGDRVLFPVDESTLTAEAKATLDQQAEWLLARPSLDVVIEGHADEQGTREYNFRLSARRAAAVRDYLVTRGLSDARLSTIPYGKERPVATCSREECWAQNRRAVTVVSGAPAV